MDIFMDISMDIHGKSVDRDMDKDGKFHIHGKPGSVMLRMHQIRLSPGLCPEPRLGSSRRSPDLKSARKEDTSLHSLPSRRHSASP